MKKIFHTLVACFSATTLLTACYNVGYKMRTAGNAIKRETIAFNERVDRYLEEDFLRPDPGWQPSTPIAEGFCYRTLGEVDCYSEPQESQRFRLVGIQLGNGGDGTGILASDLAPVESRDIPYAPALYTGMGGPYASSAPLVFTPSNPPPPAANTTGQPRDLMPAR